MKNKAATHHNLTILEPKNVPRLQQIQHCQLYRLRTSDIAGEYHALGQSQRLSMNFLNLILMNNKNNKIKSDCFNQSSKSV